MTKQRKTRTYLTAEDDSLTDGPAVKLLITEASSPDKQREITVLDINDTGMGVTCVTPLKTGQHILFNGNQEDWELPEKGIVMWTFKASYGFRAGIKFI